MRPGERKVVAVAAGRAVLAPRQAWIAWGLSGLAAVVAWLMVRELRWAGDPVCALRSLTGVGCPTCGFTRALIELASGRLVASLAFHPMALPVALQIAAGWALWGAALVRGRPVLGQRWIPAIVAANALAFAAIWLVRLVTGTLPV